MRTWNYKENSNIFYYFFFKKKYVSTEVEQKHVLEKNSYFPPSSFLRHPSLTYSTFSIFLFMLLLCYLWVLRLSVSHAEKRYVTSGKVHSHQSYFINTCFLFYSSRLIFIIFCHLLSQKKSIKNTHFVDILIGRI